MDLINLGIIYVVIAGCLIGIGNAWERNIRDRWHRNSKDE